MVTSSLPRIVSPSFAGLVGVAREDITPPPGIYARNWGAARHEIADGVHRPLTATALSLQASASTPPFLLVALDLGWWRTREDEWHVRGHVLDALRLHPSCAILNLAHTHAGPSICREDADRPGGDLVPAYLDHVRDAVLRAAQRALASRVPALLEWATGRCALAQNRDLQDPARDRIVCGCNPDGPSDDALLVGRVSAAGGRPIATLVNYACHPTTLAWDNRMISPDFVGALRETVEAATAGAPCLFLQGASGELAPREQYTGDTSVADAHGRVLAHASLAVLEAMTPPGTALEFAGVVESGAPLAMWKRTPRTPSGNLRGILLNAALPLKPDLPPLAAIDRDLAACRDPVLEERLRRKHRVRRIVGDGPTAEVPVWIWRVGDAFLVGQPEEAYALLQTELRRRFPDRAIAVMNLVNGSCGYLPPAPLYGRDIYQVWQTPFDRGSLEKLIDTCAAGIQQLINS